MQHCTTKFYPVLEFFFSEKNECGKRQDFKVTVPNYPNTNANCRPNEWTF